METKYGIGIFDNFLNSMKLYVIVEGPRKGGPKLEKQRMLDTYKLLQ